MHNWSMIYGYARVSSNGQDLAQQLAQLDTAGCTKIYREKISGGTAERPQLKRAISTLDAGDVGNSPDEPGLVSPLMTGGQRRRRKSELSLPWLVQRRDYMVRAR